MLPWCIFGQGCVYVMQLKVKSEENTPLNWLSLDVAVVYIEQELTGTLCWYISVHCNMPDKWHTSVLSIAVVLYRLEIKRVGCLGISSWLNKTRLSWSAIYQHAVVTCVGCFSSWERRRVTILVIFFCPPVSWCISRLVVLVTDMSFLPIDTGVSNTLSFPWKSNFQTSITPYSSFIGTIFLCMRRVIFESLWCVADAASKWTFIFL